MIQGHLIIFSVVELINKNVDMSSDLFLNLNLHVRGGWGGHWNPQTQPLLWYSAFFSAMFNDNLDIYFYNFFFQLQRFQTNNLKLESFVTATECRKAIQTAVKHEYVYSLSGILSCKSLVWKHKWCKIFLFQLQWSRQRKSKWISCA